MLIKLMINYLTNILLYRRVLLVIFNRRNAQVLNNRPGEQNRGKHYHQLFETINFSVHFNKNN